MAKFSLKLTKRYLRDLKLARKCDIIKKIADEQRLAYTKWGTELAHGYERRIFSDSTMTTVRVYPRSGITDTTVYYYYLSDHYIPSKFDFSRVGKATCGQYLLLHHIGITISWQLLWIGMSNMEIRYTDIGDTIRYLRIQ